MKKSIIVTVLALTGLIAIARAEVTLYGILDTGIMTENHGSNGDPNATTGLTMLPAFSQQTNRVTGEYNGGLSASRWGIHAIDPESGAEATLESPLDVPYGTDSNGRIASAYAVGSSNAGSQEGTSDGQMFARESTLGLKGRYGELKAGRQTTVMADHIADYDSVGGYFSPLAFNGGYAGAGFTAEARWDQSLKYQSAPIIPGLTASFGSKFGATNNNPGTGSAYAVGLDYQPISMIKIGAVYEANKDAQNASNSGAAGSLKITFGDTHATAVFAQLDPTSSLSIKVGGEQIITQNPSNPTYDQTINVLSGVPVTAWGVTSYTIPRQQNMFWATETFKFAPTWASSIGVYQLNTNTYGASASGATYTGGPSTAQYATANIVKSLSKHTDIYAVAATTRLNGPVWAGIPAVNSEAVGMRFKF
jgi:predicted porin